MQNSKRQPELLTLAIVLLSFGQIVLVGCGSRPSGRVIFTIQNVTDQQIDKVTIFGFDPPSPSPLAIGPIGEGDTRVVGPTASFAIELPQTCKVIIDFADGTTSEVDVPVENKTSPKFTGTLAFKIHAGDNVELLVSSD